MDFHEQFASVRLPTSARPFASFTRPAASSFPIHGMSAPRAICKASASRRWRRRAPATPMRRAFPTARKAAMTCSPISARWRRRPTCRSTPISRTALPTIPTASPKTSRAVSRPASPACRSRIRRRRDTPLYDFDTRGGARQGRARRDRPCRRRRGVHRARGKFHPRRGRSRRRHPAAARPTRRPAPIASMRRASRPASRSKRW